MIDLASDMDPDTVRVGLTRFLLFQTTNGQQTACSGRFQRSQHTSA
jgi:hypothetical protein